MIYGDLHIRHTNLTNLQGLDNLKFCGGTLQIESNNNLNSLNGLNQFKKGRHFNIINNSSLIDLYGLDNFVIYPNPNKGNFNIQFSSNSGNEIQVNIHDLRGRQIFTKSYNNSGLFNETLQLNNVQSGIYLVTVQDGSRKEIKKIIVE